MSISTVVNFIDEKGHEIVEYGSLAFPVACYQGDLGKREVRWHWHEELEAAVITGGYCTLTAGNRKYTLKAGDGFFVNSGVLHGAISEDSGTCHFQAIVFHPRLVGGGADSIIHQKYVAPLMRDMTLEAVILYSENDDHMQALAAINAAWQACSDELPGFELQVRDHLSALIYQMHTIRSNTVIDADPGSARSMMRIKQMLQFIHENYASPLSIARIAEAASISSSECLRCFRDTLGISPVKYLRQYRLQRACQLLLATTISISDISRQCGFKDLSYFTKTFRESRGIPPGEYRRSQ